MLFQYQQRVQQFLADLKQQIMNPDFTITFINVARGQIALESECIRTLGTISATIGVRAYAFSNISFGTVATTGIAGALHVRQLNYNVGDGQQYIVPRSWPWFNFYYMNNPVPVNGPPTEWAQFGAGSSGVNLPTNVSAGFGAAVTNPGSFYLNPPPDLAYVLNADAVGYPIALAGDTTVEAVPYPWTDAVPYLATYFALLSLQKRDDALGYYKLYEEAMVRIRRGMNPSVNRPLYPQERDPTMIAKLGLTQKTGAG